MGKSFLSHQRDRMVNFRVTEGEYNDLVAAAKKSDCRSVSEFCRDAVLERTDKLRVAGNSGDQLVTMLQEAVLLASARPQSMST